MSEQYTRELLRVAVAQICQTIGYNATQTSSLELLQDLLQLFIKEFSRDLLKFVEHYNRTIPNLDDVSLALSSLNINLNELMDYINNVEPINFAIDIPKFPAYKSTNLNFLKPGSSEVLTRPVHVFEHLPPILPTDGSSVIVGDSKIGSNSSLIKLKSEPEANNQTNTIDHKDNAAALPPTLVLANKNLSSHLDEHGRTTREISSVVMTIGGFISPAIEGKLPDPGIPAIIDKFFGLDAPPPPTPPPETTQSLDSQNEKKPAEEKPNSPFLKKKPSAIPTKEVVKEKNLNVEESAKKPLPPAGSSSKKPFIQPVPAASLMPLQPTMALKLLKKAKKKNAALGVNAPSGMINSLDDILVGPSGEMLSEKARHKRLKTLQKMMKKTQKQQLSDLKSQKLPQLPAFVLEMSPGPERSRIEKLLKKQAKQKQKQLKKQMEMMADKKFLSNDMTQHLKPELNPGQINAINSRSIITSGLPGTDIKANISPNLRIPQHQIYPSPTKIKEEMENPSESMDQNFIKPITSADPSLKLMMEGPTIPATIPLEREVKLSSEPDRNKLNIFKRISKAQKVPQNPAVASKAPLSSSNVFTGSEGQVINLPSGTTITPAPPAFADADGGASISKGNPMQGNIPLAMPNTFSTTPALQPDLINKPKKRGRKPGSKNQPKVLIPLGDGKLLPQAQQVPLPLLTKKQKKMKVPKNLGSIEGSHFQMNESLKDASAFGSQHLSDISLIKAGGLPSSVPPGLVAAAASAITPKAQHRKERKERDKLKTMDNFSNLMANGQIQMPDDSKAPNLNSNSIGSVQLKPMDLLLNNPMESRPPGLSPSMSKKRSATPSQNKNNNTTLTSSALAASNMLSTFLPGLQRAPTGFSLPMLPFPFPPRPGLIPAPGLFPSAANLTNFTSPTGGVGASAHKTMMGLTPPFFPFPNMKTSMGQSGGFQDANQKNHLKDIIPPPLLHSAERNYCNVAPLVPDSMKLLPDADPRPKSPPHLAALQQQHIIEGDGHGASNKKSLSPKAAYASLMSQAQNPFDGSSSAAMDLKTDRRYIKPTGGADDPIELSDDSDELPNLMTANKTTSDVLKPMKLAAPTKLSPSSTGQLPTPSLNADKPATALTPPVLQLQQEDIGQRLSKEAKKQRKLQQKNSKKAMEQTTFPMTSTVGGDNANDQFSKLAGGADLIPLNATGTAYSSKSIPTTSLTLASSASSNTLVAPNNLLDIAGTDGSGNIFNDVTITPTSFLPADISNKKKSKEHKKLRKLKEGDGVGGKIKKKKDKKDKMKAKERLELTLGQDVSTSGGVVNEKQKDRENLKKLKKDKKREKQRLMLTTQETTPVMINSSPTKQYNFPLTSAACNSNPELAAAASSAHSANTTQSGIAPNTPAATFVPQTPNFVPKLTLKIGSSQSPVPSIVSHANGESSSTQVAPISEREPSPELARFSPLVTRPPKQKSAFPSDSGSLTGTSASRNTTDPPLDYNKSLSLANRIPESSAINTSPQPLMPPPSPWLPGGTLTASSVLLPQQLMAPITTKPITEQRSTQPNIGTAGTSTGTGAQPKVTESSANATSAHGPTGARNASSQQSTVSLIAETNRPSSYVDADGNTVWICPACGKVDDGSPMIGCDGCDAWYHWECVGIMVAPNDNEDWFCRVCITRKKGLHGCNLENNEKKRKRNKKK